MNDHTAAEQGGPPPVTRGRARIRDHDRERHGLPPKGAPRSAPTGILKPKFSKVVSDGKCPKCGGTSFKAKRSVGSKAFGALFGGVGI
jgi:hypothetical protein